MESLVCAKNISYSYHTKQGEIKVLDNLSFSVNNNELLGLVGPSGCGKSTILSLLSKLILPEAGSLIFNEKENENLTGYMLQKDELFFWRNVLSNINLGNEIKKIKNNDYAIELLKKYNLYDFKDAFPHQLSGGMRQRVALIRTLCLKPKLLLLDEPFSALDYQTRLCLVEDVFKIIKGEKIASVFVTHDIQEAVSLCDKILVLTNRPAKVDSQFELCEFKDMCPSERRETPAFKSFSDAIYNRLKSMERKNE